MNKKRKIKERAYDFVVRIVKFVRSLPRNMACQELSRELLKSGTSVGANVEEAEGGFSNKDFTFEMSIAFREAKETNYWLRVVKDSGFVRSQELDYLIKESGEIKRILGSIVKTSKEGAESGAGPGR